MTDPQFVSLASDVSEHIDLARIDSFRKLQPSGQPDILPLIIGSFLRTSSGFLAAIRAAIHANDPKSLSIAAHTMKSGNGQIGANKLAAMCHNLELMGLAGDIQDGGALLEELEEECHHVELALGSILAAARRAENIAADEHGAHGHDSGKSCASSVTGKSL